MGSLQTSSLKEVLGGSIKVRGYVDIINGDYKQLHKKNHFTFPLFVQLVNVLGNGSATGSGYLYQFPFANWGTTNVFAPTMTLGTDTTTHTTIGMLNIATPIGGFPAIQPNGLSGSTGTITNGAVVTFTATWNPSTVSGTVGEVGLFIQYNTPSYQYIPSSGVNSGLITFGAGNTILSYAVPLLGSRLSVADGDFTAFAINTSAPLTINWTIQFTFA